MNSGARQAAVLDVAGALSDEEVVLRVKAGETALFEILMRRYNQRLYRVACGILGDPAEAEDVMQDAYVRAYGHLDQFAGRSSFATWLTRIAVHEALARARWRTRFVEIDAMPEPRKDALPSLWSTERGPEAQAVGRNLQAVLESAIAALPDTYRPVVMLRDVQGLSTAEAAECLDLTEPVIKVRLHRGRALLRRDLAARSGEVLGKTFEFGAERCDRVVAGVLARIGG
ncbi:MAG TPA: RNA polymerase sigma factor [Thermoanaerobaculia bacterium]|nr:RNA polymerase sigma factor [Thermoanaerobaculia bacterium]